MIRVEYNGNFNGAIAPGRVNVIGEHIDYMGFAVLPMGILQCVEVQVSSVIEGVEWRFIIEDKVWNLEDEIENCAHWSRYVIAGIKGLMEKLNLKSRGLEVKFKVNGNIPQAAGLSSSSALVVASTMAMISVLSKYMNKDAKEWISANELANLCASSERFVGTQGGG
jgi:N-acetylgalactosamine kinase